MRFRAVLLQLLWAVLLYVVFSDGAQALPCDPPALSATQPWFPVTSAPAFDKPAPHPAPDCPFYQAAWHQFLFDLQKDANGTPALLSYPALDAVFGQHAAAVAGPLVLNAGANQVTSDAVLIDRDGYPVYYAIHVNPAFAAFIRESGLDNPAGILDPARRALTSPAGVAEYKSAWRVLTNPAEFPDYLTTTAQVPRLHVAGGRLIADPTSTYLATVGLIGLHVVFAIDGHPEMIWSTFEHVDRNGSADLTPQSLVNPQREKAPLLISPNVEYILFRRGSPSLIDPAPPALADYAAHLDAVGASFTNGASPFTTPIYRAYPGSNMTQPSEDDEVLALNAGVRAEMLSAGLANDPRIHYRLVGATWLDRPEDTFAAGTVFANAPDQTTKTGPVAGQDALSSVAMESFVQIDRPGCFSCHDTQGIDVSPTISIGARRLNMSHLFSHYLQSVGD